MLYICDYLCKESILHGHFSREIKANCDLCSTVDHENMSFHNIDIVGENSVDSGYKEKDILKKQVDKIFHDFEKKNFLGTLVLTVKGTNKIKIAAKKEVSLVCPDDQNLD